MLDKKQNCICIPFRHFAILLLFKDVGGNWGTESNYLCDQLMSELPIHLKVLNSLIGLANIYSSTLVYQGLC